MKLSHIAMIVFLASLVLFVPLARPPAKYSLEPFEPVTIIVNVQNSVLIIQSNIQEDIEMDVFYLDPKDRKVISISEQAPLRGEKEIPIERRGFYRIELESGKLATVTIITEKIPDTTIVIVSLALMVAIGFQIQKQFSRSFDY